MEAIVGTFIFIIVLLNSLIYLSIFAYKKKNFPSFKLKNNKILLEGSIFSVLMYLNFFIFIFTKKIDIFILGIFLSWVISYSISHVKKAHDI